MKNTRRFISAVMALAMVSALAPMSAFADTVVDDTNNPAPKTAGFDVKYTYTNPAPTYTVTIPAGVTLSESESVNKSIEAENVTNMEENGKKIVVTLDAATNDNDTDTTFHAKNGESDATYTITAGTTAVKVGDTVAEFTGDGSVELAFSKITLPENPVAGDYTETLTFGIAVEDAAAVSANPFDAAEGALYIQIRYDDYDTKLNFTKSGDTYTYVSGQTFADGGATLTKSGDNLVLHVKPVTWSTDYDYDLSIDTVNNTYTVSRDSIYDTAITLTNWKYGDTDLASLLTKV